MRVFSSKNRSCPGGGWISHPAVATTRPPRTRARPTAQAEALLEFAVSKSIAVKSRGTLQTRRAPGDARRRRADDDAEAPGVGSDAWPVDEEMSTSFGAAAEVVRVRPRPTTRPRRWPGCWSPSRGDGAASASPTSAPAPGKLTRVAASSSAPRSSRSIPTRTCSRALRETRARRADLRRDGREAAAARRSGRRGGARPGMALGRSGAGVGRGRRACCAPGECSGWSGTSATRACRGWRVSPRSCTAATPRRCSREGDPRVDGAVRRARERAMELDAPDDRAHAARDGALAQLHHHRERRGSIRDRGGAGVAVRRDRRASEMPSSSCRT